MVQMLNLSTCRSCKKLDSEGDREESTSGRLKCIPISIKASLNKQLRSESMRSPISDKPRNSSDGVDGAHINTHCISNGVSKRIAHPSSLKKKSKRLDSFREEKEKVIKIEESWVPSPLCFHLVQIYYCNPVLFLSMLVDILFVFLQNRLASGARVIIQSRAPFDTTVVGSS